MSVFSAGGSLIQSDDRGGRAIAQARLAVSEALRGVEWDDAVRLHGRMAADEVPRRLVGTGPWAQTMAQI